MFRNTLMKTAVGAAMVIAGPALAQPHGARSGGPAASANANANANVRARAEAPANINTSANIHSNATLNSEGPAHASVNGIANASSNSVLARGAVSATALPGLTTGVSVQNSAGASVGTVSQVVTGSDGSIRAVIVTSPTGQTFRLSPSSLTISGSIATTTSTTVGG